MDERAIRGVGWTLGSFGATKIVMVVATVVLGRLLAPSDFGIVALATVAMTLLGAARDLGLGNVVVVTRDTSDRFLGTVLTMIAAVALGITLVVSAAAPLVAVVFDEPRVTWVLIALSMTSVLSAVGWFFESMLQRAYEFRRRFAAQVAQAGSYATVSIGLAVAGVDVWSLVFGQIAAQSAYCITMVCLAPRRVRPHYDPSSARIALRSGRGFLVQAGAGFIRHNLDFLVVGRALNASALGFYSMAYRFSELPYLGIADPIAKVTFPGFARMRDRNEDVSGAFLSTLRLVALVTCPLGVLLSATAEPFVVTLLGDKWLPMVGALTILGVWAALRTVDVTMGWLLNSMGHADILGRLTVVLMLPLVPGLLVAVRLGGIEAVAVVVLADIVLATGAVAVVIHRRVGISLGRQWTALRPVAIACPAMWAATWATAEATASIAAPFTLLAASVAGVLTYIVVVTLIEPDTLPRAFAQAARIARRGDPAARSA